ncbi:NAD(P)/FAD-dependent oxidoreductase [Paraconexibacter antarcticus]|uniref:NAD(P)/FAD-dependent oxidoreductase n=1 Tax=Paraconexibacter antarcticus TaxID=2949664 RepID=A0ABY5E0X3_9ACTN|nr:FAD/NAD(P)-binding oxidoreductase [Paraconexibacter antarcticus]UTI66854.1 NAD(P)/FAD-dependent oxidoreductase [Paraconexibacter antarcticus]
MTDAPAPSRRHRIVIVGGGTAGITVAAQLCRKLDGADVAIIEPSEQHYYQPLWTLVGAGVVKKESTVRREQGLIPAKATWIKDRVTELRPADDAVVLSDGSAVGYDYLIVCPGLVCNWDQVDGLTEALGHGGVVSNYAYEQCEKTWDEVQAFTGGNAVFTMPPPPIKCAGAPQKIMYLADDHWRKTGARGKATVSYYAGTPGIFSVKAFAKTLNEVLARKEIQTHFKHKLVAVQAGEKTAVFENLDTGEHTSVPYDFLHVTPPQGAPEFLKASPLSDPAGWCAVDKHTLRSPDFPNVFSLGDASSLPTSKTGAAVRKESGVLVHNLMAVISGRPESTFKSYDGYASCPLTTGYGKLVLAEFNYDLEPTPSFPFDTTKERWSMYQLKRYGLPALYWNAMMKGRV